MSDDKLYTVTVFTTWTTGEVLHDLFPILDLSPTSYFDKDDQVATLSVYYETAEEAIAVEARLQKEIESWKAFSEIGQYEINSIEIKKEDWSETWKAFFHPEKVSDRLVVKPSWEDYDAAEGEIILEIDPGMSFGTGAHGTTRGCLQMIDRISLNTPGASFIDMGSGSGILSIAAAKLGFTAIEAFDYDADAVRIAGDNFALTGVADQINVYTQDLSEYEASKTFDIVTANILPHVLLPNSDRIINAIKKESSSRLILSGILNEQYENLRDHFVAAGLEEVENIVLGQWTTGCFSPKL